MKHRMEHDRFVDRALQRAEQICQDHGARFTHLRRRVLEIIWANHTPSKAYDILAVLMREDASAKPPTVYRTLNFLMEHGLVHKINSLNAYMGCAHPDAHEECQFLICRKCGVVEECRNPEVTQAVSSTANASKFHLQKTEVELSGECAACL